MTELFVFYCCAVLIGLDKGGVPGLGALGMAMVLSVSSTNMGRALAVFVPVLACADLWAVWAYRDSVEWRVIKTLCVPVAFGMIFGFLLIGYLSEIVIRRAVGVGLLGLSVFYNASSLFGGKKVNNSHNHHHHGSEKELTSYDEESGLIKEESVLITVNDKGYHDFQHANNATAASHSKGDKNASISFMSSVLFGFFTGLLTVVANVAGPLVAAYLIILRLPKRQVNGTRAWLFLLANAIKIPCQILMGNLNSPDILLILPLALVAGATALATEAFVFPHIRQDLFEVAAWLLVAFGAIKLIVGI